MRGNAAKHPDGKNAPVARRAQLLTKYYANGVSAQFARMIGEQPGRWNNVENGYNLSAAMAQKIVATFPGMSLDWLYNGVRAGLSSKVDSDLRALESSISSTRARVGGRPKRPPR